MTPGFRFLFDIVQLESEASGQGYILIYRKDQTLINSSFVLY